MIPKIIHYCWFGRNKLPDLAKKCISSWRRFLPDYEIKEWNEDNFDVNIIPYTQQAYKAKKYAFVSDYARFWILYHYGGLYFDTDVEVIKPLDDIIEHGSFIGCENSGATVIGVNPGLGLGFPSGLCFCQEMLDLYATLSFMKDDGTLNEKTIVSYTTEVLLKHGLTNDSNIQEVAGVWIYPPDYFNPFDDLTGRLELSANTRSIHWFMNSWSDSSYLRRWLSRMSHRLFGLRLHHLKNRMKN